MPPKEAHDGRHAGPGATARTSLDIFRKVLVQVVSTTHIVIGLDAGGSKTHLRAQSPAWSAPVELRGPGANPNRIGMTEAAEVLSGLVGRVVGKEGEAPERVSVCAGVSGAGREEEQEILSAAIREALNHPRTVRVEVVHDALIALDAAYDSGSGLIVIAGTGSVALARTVDGTLLRVGGWGHLLGDPGSGYAIGQAGLRSVAAAFDGGAETVLRKRLRTQFGIANRRQLIQSVYQEDLSMQDVAPLVVDAAVEGDAVADRIVHDAADGLSEQVGWLARQSDSIASHITLLGGMVQNEHYDQVLRTHLRDHFPDWSVQQLRSEPVTGALRRAQRLLQQDAGYTP